MRITDPFEQGQVARYLFNLLASPLCTTAIALKICNENRHLVLMLALDEFDPTLPEQLRDAETVEVGTFNRTIRKAVCAALEQRVASRIDCPQGAFESNLAALTGYLNLTPVDHAFLGLVLRHRIYSPLAQILNDLSRELLDLLEICAVCLDTDLPILAERLRPTGALLSSGVLRPVDRSPSKELDDNFEILDRVLTTLTRCGVNPDETLAGILGQTAKSVLTWEEYDYLGEARDRLHNFLKQAIASRLPGVNILFWGPPGTGKTEFCKVLAARLEVQLYSVGEQDDAGEEPTRKERIDFFRLAQNLLRSQQKTLLLFDEMDDVFGYNPFARLFGERSNTGSKVFMNRLLEQNPVPTIWIINNVDRLDEAFVRRMSLAVAFKVPPANVRDRVWKRVLDRHCVELPETEFSHLAALNVTPAVIDSAARFTREVGGEVKDFRFAAEGIVQAMRGGSPLPPEEKPELFLPGLTCADLDLAALIGHLTSSGSRHFSLCLYGPPGTGKSAYLRHLAKQLGMPVLLKRASDLLDMFVGNSEKQIAHAFAEALDLEAFLIFDEADSLLSDRRLAQRSWEVSQVNEMLTWMERHPLPFACTTNLRERLDPASLRRFTIKAHLDYMSPGQVVVAFRHFFEQSIELPTARAIGRVTPGDFALVERKARLFGQRDNPERLIEMLCQEVDCRNDTPMKAIGFAPLEKTKVMYIDRTASTRGVK